MARNSLKGSRSRSITLGFQSNGRLDIYAKIHIIKAIIIYLNDEDILPYEKILQPKFDDFGLYVFNPESGSLSLEEYPEKIVLPVDAAVTNEYTNDEEYRTKKISDIKEDEMGLDIGDETLQLFEDNCKDAKIVVWNGPLGVYEFSKYKKNTLNLLKYLVDNNIKSILGGGDIVAAASDYKDKIYHASTGGGVTLEYLEGKELPGIVAIK